MLFAIGHCSFLLGLVVLLLSVVVLRGAASLAPVHGDELRAVGGLAGVFEVEVRAELDDLVQLPAAEEARQAHEVLVAGQVRGWGSVRGSSFGASSGRFIRSSWVRQTRVSRGRETGTASSRGASSKAGRTRAGSACARCRGESPRRCAASRCVLVQDQHGEQQLASSPTIGSSHARSSATSSSNDSPGVSPSAGVRLFDVPLGARGGRGLVETLAMPVVLIGVPIEGVSGRSIRPSARPARGGACDRYITSRSVLRTSVAATR
jgi:hypothetical protein